MRDSEYHLYRVKFIKPAQQGLFSPNITPREIFERALAERPSLELRAGNEWHIGNVEDVGPDGGRFAVGRITRTTVERYDPQTGDFRELPDESGPYTFVYFDSRLGLLAIARKPRVAYDVKSISRKIQKLLGATSIVTDNQIDVRIAPIPDPEGFLQKLYSAHAIKRFKATFTGPNPIDADAFFQKPLSYLCQQVDGEEGSVTVKGKSLNEESVAAVAKSTAATGNTVSAWIQAEANSRITSITLEGEARKVFIDADAEKQRALAHIRAAYREVRG